MHIYYKIKILFPSGYGVDLIFLHLQKNDLDKWHRGWMDGKSLDLQLSMHPTLCVTLIATLKPPETQFIHKYK